MTPSRTPTHPTASASTPHILPASALPATSPAVLPFTCSIVDATWLFGLSRATLYRLAKAGNVRLVKIGRRSLLDVGSMQRHLGGLPALHQAI